MSESLTLLKQADILLAALIPNSELSDHILLAHLMSKHILSGAMIFLERYLANIFSRDRFQKKAESLKECSFYVTIMKNLLLQRFLT